MTVRRDYDERALDAGFNSRSRPSSFVAWSDRFAGGGRGVSRLVVLAAAAVARIQSRNGGRGALAMAGRGSLRAGIRGCAALHLGFWMDGTRHAGPSGSAAAPRSCWFLLLRAQSHVRGFRRWMDRPVDYLRTRGAKIDGRGRSGCVSGESVRPFLRGANVAPEVRCAVRRVPTKRAPLVAARNGLGPSLMEQIDGTCLGRISRGNKMGFGNPGRGRPGLH